MLTLFEDRSDSMTRIPLAIVLLCGICIAADEPAKDTVVLFDGKSLDGWEGNLKSFRVQEGAIVGGTLAERIPRNEFLCTKQEYADFELKLKFKLLGQGANAGVQIRSRRIPNHHEVIGYQADMGDGWWGALYDESRRRKVLAAPEKETVEKALKRGDWNEYVIRCQGRRIQLSINGVKTVDYTEPDETLEQKGLIGLQIHGGPPSEAWYKDITLRPL
jgi:hypothetical protein